jgi:hypothetical protein
MTYGLTPAVLSDLHRLQPSRHRARVHIFDANCGEVTASKQTSNLPAWQILRSWGKDSVAPIGARLRENVNRFPRESRHIGDIEQLDGNRPTPTSRDC